VKNTRSVLKHFREHGTFLEPNAIVEPGNLAKQIAYVNFHKREQCAKVSLRPNLRRPLKKTVYCKPDTELLCAIEKKS
jgi:hypothetical protein